MNDAKFLGNQNKLNQSATQIEVPIAARGDVLSAVATSLQWESLMFSSEYLISESLSTSGSYPLQLCFAYSRPPRDGLEWNQICSARINREMVSAIAARVERNRIKFAGKIPQPWPSRDPKIGVCVSLCIRLRSNHLKVEAQLRSHGMYQIAAWDSFRDISEHCMAFELNIRSLSLVA